MVVATWLMDQFIDIASKFGIPVALLVLVGWFLVKKVWPFVTKQIEDSQALRKAESDKFDNTIRTRDALMVQQWQEHLKALDTLGTAITTEMRGLREDIQSNRPARRITKRR